MIMGFVDLLKRNGYQVEVRGSEIMAVKGSETYKYVLKSFGRHKMEAYDMGFSRTAIVYSDGKETVCDFVDGGRKHDTGSTDRELTILQQLGILRDSHAKDSYRLSCCGYRGGERLI